MSTHYCSNTAHSPNPIALNNLLPFNKNDSNIIQNNSEFVDEALKKDQKIDLNDIKNIS